MGRADLQGIATRVRLARTFLTREIVGGGLLRLITTLAAGFVLGVALHLLVRSGTAVAWGLTLALVAGVGSVAWRFLFRPLAQRPGDDGLVEWLDRRLTPAGTSATGRKNLIVTAWQLGRSSRGSAVAGAEFAPDLVEALVQRGSAAAATVPVDRWRDRSTDRRWLATLGVTAVAGLALFLVSGPRRFGLAASKLIDPRRAELVPPGIAITPGHVTVEKGVDVPLTVEVRGSRETPLLRVREAGGNWMTRRLESPVAVDDTKPESPLEYASALRDVERDLEYEVHVGRLESPVYRITVNEPPRVGGFEITYAYPDYTGKPSETVTTGTGDMAVLVGTRVRLKVLANRSMPSAWMMTGAFGAATLTDRRVLTSVAPEAGGSGRGDSWETTFTVEDSFDYTVALGDQPTPGDPAGPERFTTGRFHLEAVPDRSPVVRLLYPNQDMKIPEEMNLTLQTDGVDDFGLSRLDLVYDIKDGKSGRLRLKDFRAGQGEFQAEFPWDLIPFNLSPGMEVSYFLELYDNDTLHGPKSARSDVRRLRFPTMDEIYAEVHEEHGEQIDELSTALEKTQDLQKEMEKLSREMKRDGRNSWDKQKEVENLLQKQKELQQQIQDTAKSLEETLNKAQEETLMSPELLQKMQEIAQLMQSIQNEKIKEAFQKLSEAMKNLDKDAVNKAMEEIKLDQEQMAQSIERTLEMLKEIRKEELLEDAVRKAEEMARQQEDLARKMEQEKKDGAKPDQNKGKDAKKGEAKDDKKGKDADKKDGDKKDGKEEKPGEGKDQAGKDPKKEGKDGQTPDDKKAGKPTPEQDALAKQQEEIRKQAEELKKQMDELEKMAANEPELQKDLKEAQENEETSEMRQDMEQSQQKMEQGEMEKALNFAFKARDKAKQLSQMMNQAQQQSNAAKKRELQERMMQVIQDLVDVSSAQEELLAQAEAVDDGELAQRQQVIAEGVVKAGMQLEALGKRTIFVPQGQQSRLTTALNKMKNATRSLTGGNRNLALRDGKESAGDLNEAIVELMQANEGMCNMPSSSGMMESMQKMQSLSQQQQDLNGETKSSESMGSSPRLGQGRNEQLERLAAQQEMIQKGLNEVGGELQGRKDVLGRLDQLSQEMADVAAELRKNGVDERLLERQQKILSRMLDAQKSIRKRDDENKRESKTAEQLFRPGGPPPLTRDQLLGPERLRSDILKGQSDNYPSQYRALVEQYFRALADRKGGAGKQKP